MQNNDECETVTIALSTVQRIKIDTSGSVDVLMSSPALFGSKAMSPADGHDPSHVVFNIRRPDIEKFTNTLANRGLVSTDLPSCPQCCK